VVTTSLPNRNFQTGSKRFDTVYKNPIEGFQASFQPGMLNIPLGYIFWITKVSDNDHGPTQETVHRR
jgi:hypothetical protein